VHRPRRCASAQHPINAPLDAAAFGGYRFTAVHDDDDPPATAASSRARARPAFDVRFHFIEVSLQGAADPVLRERLLAISTTLGLHAADVAALRA